MQRPCTEQASLTLGNASAGSQQAPQKPSGHTPCPAAGLDLALQLLELPGQQQDAVVSSALQGRSCVDAAVAWDLSAEDGTVEVRSCQQAQVRGDAPEKVSCELLQVGLCSSPRS